MEIVNFKHVVTFSGKDLQQMADRCQAELENILKQGILTIRVLNKDGSIEEFTEGKNHQKAQITDDL